MARPAFVTDHLADLEFAELANQPGPSTRLMKQRRERRRGGAERDVARHVQRADAIGAARRAGNRASAGQLHGVAPPHARAARRASYLHEHDTTRLSTERRHRLGGRCASAKCVTAARARSATATAASPNARTDSPPIVTSTSDLRAHRPRVRTLRAGAQTRARVPASRRAPRQRAARAGSDAITRARGAQPAD